MDKDIKNPIVIIAIIIVIIALFYFGYTMFYPSNEEQVPVPVPVPVPVSSSSIDNNKLDKALKASGINISGKETFNSDIIFDSYDKINKNVNIFFNTYLPSIDINNINALLKENNCDDIQTVINNKNINVSRYILNDGAIMLIAFMIYSENNKTNIILFGLLIFYQLELSMREFIMKQNPNTPFIKSSNMYYLNDYDEVNDFFIYTIPISYTGEISNKLNKDATVKEVEFNTPNMFQKNNQETIHKISLAKLFRPMFNMVISGAIKKEPTNITDDDFNNFINLLKENTQSLKKMINFNIASKLIIANNNDITVDTKIVGDIADLMSPSNFTKSFADFMSLNNDLTRSDKLIQMADVIKMDYNNYTNNTQIR
jgi:hypothetical protein